MSVCKDIKWYTRLNSSPLPVLAERRQNPSPPDRTCQTHRTFNPGRRPPVFQSAWTYSWRGPARHAAV